MSEKFDEFSSGLPSVVYTSAAAGPLFNIYLLLLCFELDVKWLICSSDIFKKLSSDYKIKIKSAPFAKASVESNDENPTPRDVKAVAVKEIKNTNPNLENEIKILYTEQIIVDIEKYMGSKQDVMNKEAWTHCDFFTAWDHILQRYVTNENSDSLYNKIVDNTDKTLHICNFFDIKNYGDKHYFRVKFSEEEFKMTVANTISNKKFAHQVFFYHLIKVKLANIVLEDPNISKYFHQVTYIEYLEDLKKEAEKMGYIN
jgi:hypothetical protein